MLFELLNLGACTIYIITLNVCSSQVPNNYVYYKYFFLEAVVDMK